MHFVQLESLIDLRRKNGHSRYLRSLAFAALLVGTALVCTLFIGGVIRYQTLPAVAPLGTSIQVRPDYPVSSFVYERGVFKWFLAIGIAVGLGAGFAALGPSCVAAGPLEVSGCVLGAVAGVSALVGTIRNALKDRVQEKRYHVAKSTMLFMDYVDKSSKREIDPAQEFLDNVFGSTYRFAGNITKDDEFNAHLVERNKGENVPVFSFTSPYGIQFHHVMIYNEDDGAMFHRLGFNDAKPELDRREESYGTIQAYFTSGGLDLEDCSTDNGNDQYLTESDHIQMAQSLQCADPNFSSNSELALQIYDQTTGETIGAGRIAPVKADGSSPITDSQFANCPSGLTKGESCAAHSDPD